VVAVGVADVAGVGGGGGVLRCVATIAIAFRCGWCIRSVERRWFAGERNGERRICEREVGGVGWLSMAVYRRTHKVRVCVCGKVCNLKERKRNKKEREKRNKNIYIQGFDRIHGLLVIRSKQSKAHHPNDERSGSHVGTKAIAFRLKFSRR